MRQQIFSIIVALLISTGIFSSGAYALPPTITAVPASETTTTGGTLNAMVSPNGENTTVTFVYGLTTDYGNTVTASQSPLASDAGGSAVSASISGLACNTSYHFRAEAVNDSGTTHGDCLNIITEPCPVTERSDELPGVIFTLAGTGDAAYSGDDGPSISASLNLPYGVALDSGGNIYFSDLNNRIRKITAETGVITTVAGNGTAGFSGDDGPATSASLNNCGGVTFDKDGNMYIADYGNHRIRMVAAGTGIITTVAGNGSADFSGDGGPATAAGMTPNWVAIDSAGNLYIAEYDNQRIRLVASGSGIISTVAGNGAADFSGDGGPAVSASLNYPTMVTLDKGGNLYIADSLNNRIRMVTAASGIISTVAGNGTYEYSGDNGPAIAAGFKNAFGVTIDKIGNIYISDIGSQRIRKITTGTGIIATVAGNGIDGFSGDDGQATSASLSWPIGTSIDSSGNIYIADHGNNRIRKVMSIAVAPAVTTVAASAISKTAATLNGTVNDNFAATTVAFEFGTTTGYGNSVAAGTVTTGSGNTAVSADISGLSCGNTYHFRVVGINSAGTANGDDQTFAASACTATLTFTSGSNGSLTGATSQTVNAGSSSSAVTAVPDSSYHFVDWTGDNGFVTTTANPLTVINVTAAQTITANFAHDLIAGVCGAANGQAYKSAPTSGFCSPDAVATLTPTPSGWNWECSGQYGGTTASCSAIKDDSGPVIVLSTLSDGASTGKKVLNVAGSVSDASAIATFTINGVDLLTHAADFSQAVMLHKGANTITITASDSLTNSTTLTRTITYDPAAPAITVTAPADNSITGLDAVTVTGTLGVAATVKARINGGSWLTADGAGTTGFSIMLPLTIGFNHLELTLDDGATTIAKRTISRVSGKPALTLTPADQDRTSAAFTATITGVTDPVVTNVTVNFNGTDYPQTVTGGSFSQAVTFVTPHQSYPVTITAADDFGNSSTIIRNIIFTPNSTADFNGDGNADILWRNSSDGQNMVWVMNDTVYMSNAMLLTEADPGWKIAGSADFNGDGKTDILWRHATSGAMHVWYMNGSSITSSADITQVNTNPAWLMAGTGDFNGDGKPDILWRNSSNGKNMVWFMNGVTWLSTTLLQTETDQNWKIAGVADMNGDDKTDIVWRNSTTGVNRVWYMDGGSFQSTVAIPQPITNTAWEIADVADFNGDGKADILWRNNSNGKNMIWYMDGINWLYNSVIAQPNSNLSWQIMGR